MDHDQDFLFSHWGALKHDRDIARVTRGIGWCGMIATTAWLTWMHFRTEE